MQLLSQGALQQYARLQITLALNNATGAEVGNCYFENSSATSLAIC